MLFASINQKKKKAEEELDAVKQELEKLTKQRDDMKFDIDKYKRDISCLESQLDDMRNQKNAIEQMYEYGLEPCKDSMDKLLKKKHRLSLQMETIIMNQLYEITTPYALNGSNRKGKEVQDAFGKGLTYSLSSYIDAKAKSLTATNVNKNIELVNSKFATYQNKANKMGITLNKDYASCRIDMMKNDLDIKTRDKAEKARQKEEAKRLHDEEKALAEAELEQRRLEQERKAMETVYGKALTDSERDKIKAKLESIDKRIGDVKYRCTHYKCGFLYVITSTALPGMVKIGATRRLPYMRVRELSSSSLPYPFHLDAYCFCNDVFDIEAKAHKILNEHRINADREFFNVSVQDAVKVLTDNLGQDVRYGIYEGDEQNDI